VVVCYRRTLIILAALLLCSAVSASDLYKVVVQSEVDADVLSHLYTDPIVPLRDGYLVLAHGESAEKLKTSGLNYELIARDVERNQLALDGRKDRKNVEMAPLIFEEDDLRLFRFDESELLSMPDPPQLFPIGMDRPLITYHVPVLKAARAIRGVEDLQTLISIVEHDSLLAWTQLEHWLTRPKN